jgi:lysophospholipase L1-like esterase
MIDCVIIGDSIAVGVSQARPECHAKAHIGWDSKRWNLAYLPQVASKSIKTLIISLGANDTNRVPTESELRKLRAAVKADKVFWIGLALHRKPTQNAIVEQIAKEFGDEVIKRPTTNISPDNVHPNRAGYNAIAMRTR